LAPITSSQSSFPPSPGPCQRPSGLCP
jgi:hypothetical protein